MFNAFAHKKIWWRPDPHQRSSAEQPNHFVADGWIAENKKPFVSK
jgi:hypothetical protein